MNNSSSTVSFFGAVLALTSLILSQLISDQPRYAEKKRAFTASEKGAVKNIGEV